MKERMKRFDEFMQYKGLNDNQVTVQCSLSKGLLGRARKGLSDLGTNAIIKLANVYGDLNETWLLTGEGEMLNYSEEEDPDKEIPLLPVSAIGGSLSGDDIGVMPYECERILSPIREAELAIRVSGDSMYPRYPNGSMVFVRKWDASRYIDYGKYYVLNTTNGTIIKQVRKGEGETLRCVSVNQDYDPYDIPKSEVRAMYVVLGCLHLE